MNRNASAAIDCAIVTNAKLKDGLRGNAGMNQVATISAVAVVCAFQKAVPAKLAVYVGQPFVRFASCTRF